MPDMVAGRRGLLVIAVMAVSPSKFLSQMLISRFGQNLHHYSPVQEQLRILLASFQPEKSVSLMLKVWDQMYSYQSTTMARQMYQRTTLKASSHRGMTKNLQNIFIRQLLLLSVSPIKGSRMMVME